MRTTSPVADQRLGPESDGDAHDSEARDGRTDVDVEAGRERHEHRHDHDHHAAGSHRGSLERPHPALQLNLGQDRVGFLRLPRQESARDLAGSDTKRVPGDQGNDPDQQDRRRTLPAGIDPEGGKQLAHAQMVAMRAVLPRVGRGVLPSPRERPRHRGRMVRIANRHALQEG